MSNRTSVKTQTALDLLTDGELVESLLQVVSKQWHKAFKRQLELSSEASYLAAQGDTQEALNKQAEATLQSILMKDYGEIHQEMQKIICR